MACSAALAGARPPVSCGRLVGPHAAPPRTSSPAACAGSSVLQTTGRPASRCAALTLHGDQPCALEATPPASPPAPARLNRKLPCAAAATSTAPCTAAALPRHPHARPAAAPHRRASTPTACLPSPTCRSTWSSLPRWSAGTPACGRGCALWCAWGVAGLHVGRRARPCRLVAMFQLPFLQSMDAAPLEPSCTASFLNAGRPGWLHARHLDSATGALAGAGLHEG